MRRLLIAASLFLVAATAAEVIPALEADGYYIEPGSSASIEVVSDAVFEGRADGGRLYMVILAEEPPGGATTFSDSVLDDLDEGYVVTVAPETVGFAGDGSYWSVDEMNTAVDASLSGSSDDEVVALFIRSLTGASGAPPAGGQTPSSSGGFSGWAWLLIIGGVIGVLIWMTRRGAKRRSETAARELENVKAMARQKLADIANDIIEMEDEIELSDNADVKAHYKSASATYTETLAKFEGSPSAQEMMGVIGKLDVAIWELDAAEALLDGKPVPERPKPPEPAPPPSATPIPPPVRTPRDNVDRRPQRQSSYAGPDMMAALWAILAMTNRGGGMPGGFGGPVRTGSGGPRMSGGGRRMGGFGRMRGGGRRR